jgi:hypothetical protein
MTALTASMQQSASISFANRTGGGRMLGKRKSEPAVYRNGMAQTNGEPVEDIPDAAEIPDNVNHPAHYTFGSIEVIDAIEGLLLPYHLGNAVKYIARAGRKDPTKTEEDLRKAIWYINRYIEFLGKQKKGDRHVD